MRSLATSIVAALAIGAAGAVATGAHAQADESIYQDEAPETAIPGAGTSGAGTSGAGTLGARTPGARTMAQPTLPPASAAAVPSRSPVAVVKPDDVTGSLAKAGAAPVAPRKAAGDDPEPDAAIAPPATASKDPLDALAPGATPTTSSTAATPAAPSAPATAPVPAASAPDVLPPANAALKAVLDAHAAVDIKGSGAGERRKEREAIAFFYAARAFAPVWSSDGKAIVAVDGVMARLARAADDALTLPTPPTTLLTEGTPAAVAESELVLTESVVAYARQATGSRIDPRVISPLIGSLPQRADPAEVLDAVADAGAAGGDILWTLNPTEPRYVALRQKLAELHVAHAPATVIPAGPTLHVGMHDKRVPLLRARFSLDVGLDGGLDGNSDPLVYDSELAAAVAGFQRENGLPTSGTLNQATRAALAGGARPSRLEGDIVANMEMWRWMPRDLGANRIEVNVPDYVVTVYKDGAEVSKNRVVVGKLDTPTPLFSNTMKYLIVNPVWNVPQSIIKKEFLPKGGGDLSYLQRRGFTVGYHDGMAVVKQNSGEKNALGRIKFLFPNDYSVYLHDTPSKALFSASRRAFSHGCVRVDQPFAFAESVMNDAVPADGKKRWSEERLEDMIGDKERTVNLPVPLPIHIEYFTASVDADSGEVKLREDVYGYAHAVAAALGQESEPVPAVKPKLVAERRRKPAAADVVVDSVDPR